MSSIAKKSEGIGFLEKVKKYVRGVTTELKKVHWPNRKNLTTYTAVVVASVFIVGFAIWIVDSGILFLTNLILR